MADGFTLIVPKEMIDRLDVADQKIAKLADTAEKSTKRINEAFNNIAVNGGLDAFIKKLNEANTTLSKMSVNTNGLKDITNALNEINKVSNKSGDTSPVNDAAVQTSVDKINELVNSLVRLKELNQISLQTQQAGVDYAQQANDIKELANAEAERERALKREDVAREKNNKNEQSLATQRLANDTKELLNAELERNKQLSVESANIKNNYAQQSLEAKRVANDVKEAMYAEQERARQMQLQNQKNIAAYKEQSAELKRQIAEIERLAKAYKEMPKTFSWDDLSQHIDASQSATSINQRIVAIHNLKSALKDLDTTDANYKQHEKELNDEIARQEKELNKVGVRVKDATQKKKGLLNISDQLQRKLALLFSVSAIQGYINKLVQVRGEFELQQRSLEILLQNKKEADRLWDQTVRLAVKSPFTVKQLVTYTKQLAAYRIESDKLYETNKMLADVSAGLGVDMQRLILAFGQVKAANFLRGTELRQFSEAGVNMLDELAKKITEVEGRTVSVGEVFDRVSKRMVSFKDVEEVFKNITSKGGIFYQMQEKQAETLAGQMANLRDSYDLMLNEIGKDNEGIIKGSIQGLRNLIKEWQQVAPAITAAVKIYATFLSLKGLTKLISGVKSLHESLVNVATGAKSASTALSKIGGTGGGILMIVSIIISLGVAIYDTLNAADKFQREFNAIDRETLKNEQEAISNFIELANVLKNASEGSEEFNAAMDDLKRIFKDMLPDEMLKIENIRNMEQGYKDAAAAIRLYYSIEASEKKKAAAAKTLDENIERDYDDIVENLSMRLDSFVSDGLSISDGIGSYHYEKMPQEMADAIRAGYINALNMAIDSAKNGEIAATGESLKEAFYKNLSDFSGFSTSEIEYWLENTEEAFKSSQYALREDLEDIAEEVATYRKKTGDIDIQARPGETREIQKQRLEYEKQAKVLGELGTKYSDLKAKIAAYYEILQKERKGEKVDSPTKVNLEKEIADAYRNLQVEVPIKPSFVMKEGETFDFSKLFTDQTAVDDEISRIGTAIYTSFKNQIIPPVNEASDSISILNNNAQALEQTTPSIWDFSSAMGGLEESSTNIEQLDFTKPFDFLSQYIDDADSASTATGQLGEDVDKLLNGFNLDPIQRFTRGVIESVAEASGLSLDLFDNIQMQSGAALTDFQGKVKSAMETVEARYLETKQILENNPINSTVVTYYVQSQGLESVDELKKRMEEDRKLIQSYQQMLKRTGWVDPKAKKPKAKKDKKSKTTTKKTDDPAEALRYLLGDMYDSFQDFNEEVSADAANTKLSEIYIKEFERLAKKVSGFKLPFPKFEQGSDETFQKYMTELYRLAKQETKDRIDDDKRKAKEESYIEDAKELNEETKEHIDLLFEEYEIYKELEKIGMSPAMAKGLFGISTTSLNDITQKLQELKDAGKFEGTNMTEAYEEYSKKIKDEETKQQQDRLKIYAEYAKKSVGERAKIELEYLNHMAEIEKATIGRGTDADKDGYLQSVYDNATAKSMEERKAALQKFEWKEFQKSDIFLMIFEDLENANANLVRSTLSKIKEYKDAWTDMPLDEVKVMTDKIMQLETALLKLESPFKALKITKGEIKSILGGQTREQVYEESLQASERISINEKDIDKLSAMRSLWQQNGHITQEIAMTLADMGIITKGNIAVLDDEIAKRKKANQSLQQAVDRAKALAKADKKSVEYRKAQADAYNNLNSEAQKLFDCTRDLMEVFGDKDGIASIFVDMSSSIVDTVFSTLALQANINAVKLALDAAGVSASSFGYILNTAMGVIGWIVMGVQLITQAFSAAFKAHDKKKQKEIDEEIKSIERLEKELENLEERLEAVYSLGGVNKSMRQVQANIDTQIQSYERMIRLEEEKKSTDEEQIDEWEENIEELREKRKELHKEMVESLGGNYDVRSVAREFVDAWIDAFKETGDGLKGLRDNFKDFFLNILLEQAVMQKVGGLFSDAMDYLNDTVLSDYIVTDAERKKTEGMFDEAMIKTNDYLNLLFGENGVLNKYIDDTDSSLSGLQQGIQGVTEETAQIIEAYLNSIRFYIAQDNQNLAKLVDTFTNVESPNPILSELRTQTELITSIRDLFRDVVRVGHPTYGGAFLKVAL